MVFSANTVAVIYEGAEADLQRGPFSKICLMRLWRFHWHRVETAPDDFLAGINVPPD
ncbi:MAG: hypothetical protein L3J30_05825 [Marinosulfonomonas sp.]|nr:hypothetical protein [Marinosulfonomonas sp.]